MDTTAGLIIGAACVVWLLWGILREARRPAPTHRHEQERP